MVPRTPRRIKATEMGSPVWLLDWTNATTIAAMLARQAMMIASSVT
jgi:hypothetical protein